MHEIVTRAVEAGIDWLQLRERDLDGAAWLEWGRPLCKAARSAAKRSGRPLAVTVNRRVDLALVLGADGIHLGFDALDSAQARNRMGASRLVGVSTHSEDEVDRARLPGADYVHLAPIFDPISKPASRQAAGLETLATACQRDLPVLAQGGIEVSNAASVLAAGARGIAVTGSVVSAADPASVVRALRAVLDRA